MYIVQYSAMCIEHFTIKILKSPRMTLWLAYYARQHNWCKPKYRSIVHMGLPHNIFKHIETTYACAFLSRFIYTEEHFTALYSLTGAQPYQLGMGVQVILNTLARYRATIIIFITRHQTIRKLAYPLLKKQPQWYHDFPSSKEESSE